MEDIFSINGADFLRPNKRSRMFDTNPWAVVGLLFVISVIVVVTYTMVGNRSTACPTELHRRSDGSLELRPTGQTFHDMNAFQQWWHVPGLAGCPLPLLTGAREVPVMENQNGNEQTYAKTPIYKVDDYELSRIVGNERDGHMIMPRENYNMILGERTFDWADRPMSSDERRGKYQGLSEGFTAAGELKSEKKAVREAVARYGERSGYPAGERSGYPAGERSGYPAGERSGYPAVDNDLECKMSREAREVGNMVARAYDSDPNWEPVVTKIGPHHWEVNELKPRRRHGDIDVSEVVDHVVDTTNDAVDVQFRYREKPVVEDAIDPYFGGIGPANTALPFTSDRYSSRQADPFAGPVPGMERMFGPTFDHKAWF
jgi:hypothetical protein